MNSLNITSTIKRNTNGGDDDDDDDELINTIIQQIEQKEKQRQDKEAAVMEAAAAIEEKENANKRANTVTFEANTKHTDTVVVCTKTSSNNSKMNGNQKSKHMRGGQKGSKRLASRYQPLVSRIDPIANNEPVNIGIANANANVHTQLLLRSNPDLSRPNEVSYLFRLPIDNPNPAPILIVKK